MAQILDQFGRPIERATLTEPQTARVGWLAQTFAGHPSRGLTPAKLARILEDAERGDMIAQFDLFEDMEEKDGHILAEMGKRKRGLLGIAWDIQAPRNATAAETKLAEAVREQIQEIPNLEDVLLDMADAVGKGFAALEIEWARAGASWLPGKVCFRPQQWFQLDQATRTEVRLRDGTADGGELQPFGWILHVHRARSGYIARAGLHRALCWPYLFKNYSVRDCAEFCEIYGLPVRLGRYPSGAGDKEKATLLSAVVGLGHAAAGIIPEGMSIELLEAAKGTHEPFAFIVDWAERTESKLILGQTTSSEAKATGLGSGVAQLHGEVRRDILEADAIQLAGTLTRDLVYPLAALNFGQMDPRRAPRWVFDTREAADLKTLGDALKTVVDMGVRVPVSYVYERAKLPQPKENEPVLERGRASPPAQPPAIGGEAAARLAVLATAFEDRTPASFADQDALDRTLATLPPEALQRQMEGPLKPVFELIERGASFEEIGGALAEAYPDMDASRLEELLARALFVAETWGRLSAAQESQ